MALTLSGTNGVVGAGFTLDASGASVTAGVGTFAIGAFSETSTFANSINLTHASAGSNYIYFNEDLQFAKNGTGTRLKIDSSGRLGINTDTFNDAREAMRVQAPAGQTETFLTISAASTTGKSNLFFGDNDFNEGRIQYDHSDNSMQFFTNDTERLTVTDNVKVENGNIVIGTSGKGIDFSATGDGSGTDTSELLDDYEEGTFTFGTSTNSGSVTLAGAYDTGGYTKIGRVVHVSAYLAVGSISSPSGSFFLTGLPYTSADLTEKAAYARFPVSLYLNGPNLPDGHAYYNASAIVIESSTQIQLMFRGTNTNGKLTTDIDGNVNPGSDFFLNFSYIAA